MKWVSERDGLPPVAQDVLLARPRKLDPFWDISVARILIRYEGVVVDPSQERPTDWWWSKDTGTNVMLITGHSWWASLTELELPPGAIHQKTGGFDLIVREE